jgi:hypothetical protein
LKIVKKILLYGLLVLAVLSVSLIISVFIFREQIIKQFIAEANERLSTPVKIKKIDVSAFSHFPNLSIVFTDVYVEDSHPGQYPLLTASRVSFQLNPLEVYRGIYNIKGLEIKACETNLKINREGVSNFNVVKKIEQDTPQSSIGIELKNVKLKNVLVHYVDYPANQDFHFSTNELSAFIKSVNDIYSIGVSGEVTSKKIRIETTTILEDKTFEVDGNLVYNNPERTLTIKPTQLNLGKSVFLVNGLYEWKEKPIINLNLNGKNTTIQTLISLLPDNSAGRIQQYKSEGDVYFAAIIKGEITAAKKPSLSIEFGLRDATVIHPVTKAKIKNANVEGSFANSSLTDLRNAALVLKNINATLDEKPFEANLIIRNFIDSEVIFNFKGGFDAASLNSFYPIADVTEVTGILNADISFEGRLSWLKNKATAQRASTSGTIDIQNLSFLYGPSKVAIQNVKGTLQFNKNDMALSNVGGVIGNSQVLLNGFFKNIVTFILFDDQPVGIEADLKSEVLDVDQLFALAFGESSGKTHEYNFSISPNVYLNFNCDVKKLKYKRFVARGLKGDLLVKNQMAVSKKIQLNTMGGSLSLSGIVDATNNKAIDVISSAKLSGIHADSLFYVFENFGQTFIESKHLKGQAAADVNFELTLNEKLKLYPATLIADVSATIKNGELNNFEPLQKLNKYLDDAGLNKLRFADLKNDIHIENKTIYIPQMQVRSNVTTLQISGTHTFDQHIDYRIVTPLLNRSKHTNSEASEAIESTNGQPKLHLRIVGTTDDYQVKYDGEAVRKKIAGDLKKEVQELKDAFKNKGVKKKKEIELSTEEFDW